jgi:hypothetical protein
MRAHALALAGLVLMIVGVLYLWGVVPSFVR